MNGRAYYNEIEPYAAAWLRNLIDARLVPPGDVDERDIRNVRPSDLIGYDACHFFAGIGGWALALRLAGWPDDRPVWTGSCPCQPFSAAGKRGGVADERHLWPHWFHLIGECRPPVVFGEQVASKDGLGWLDLVSADLEGSSYACGAADMCAAGVGAPHIRQRLWFVAERLADAEGCGGREQSRYISSAASAGEREVAGQRHGYATWANGTTHGLADSDGAGPEPGQRDDPPARHGAPAAADRDDGRLADADGRHPGTEGIQRGGEHRQQPKDGGTGAVHRPGPTNGLWRDADWLGCRDGKWRPVEPGTFPLAHGVSARVGRLRAYGNAIVPQVGATFVRAYLEMTQEDAA